MSPRVLWGVALSLLLSLLAIVWLLPSTPPVQSLTGAAVLPGPALSSAKRSSTS